MVDSFVVSVVNFVKEPILEDGRFIASKVTNRLLLVPVISSSLLYQADFFSELCMTAEVQAFTTYLSVTRDDKESYFLLLVRVPRSDVRNLSSSQLQTLSLLVVYSLRANPTILDHSINSFRVVVYSQAFARHKTYEPFFEGSDLHSMVSVGEVGSTLFLVH